jgi:hypothetical protein
VQGVHKAACSKLGLITREYSWQPDVIREIKWTGHVARVEKLRNADNILVGDLKGRDYLGDSRRCEHNI